MRGLLLLLVFYALADVMQLRTVRWVLTNVMQIGFIAAIVLFQPELRRTLEHMGQSTNWTKLLFTTHRQDPPCAAHGRAPWWPSAMQPSSFPIRAPAH